MSAASLTRVRASYDDDYDWLSGSFARACRDADRQRQDQEISARPPVDKLPASTRQAVEWLLKNNDAERLNKFIAEHSPSDAQFIVAYIKGRQR